jgi:hypothetical protein
MQADLSGSLMLGVFYGLNDLFLFFCLKKIGYTHLWS